MLVPSVLIHVFVQLQFLIYNAEQHKQSGEKPLVILQGLEIHADAVTLCPIYLYVNNDLSSVYLAKQFVRSDV